MARRAYPEAASAVGDRRPLGGGATSVKPAATAGVEVGAWEGMAMAVTTTPLDAVQRLGPVIAAHADRAEQDRRLPAETVRALADAGVFRLLVPRALGGAEVEPATVCRVVEEIARVDGASGW